MLLIIFQNQNPASHNSNSLSMKSLHAGNPITARNIEHKQTIILGWIWIISGFKVILNSTIRNRNDYTDDLRLIVRFYNLSTCRTKAEEERERAAPITTASSMLLMFTWNSSKPIPKKQKLSFFFLENTCKITSVTRLSINNNKRKHTKPKNC